MIYKFQTLWFLVRKFIDVGMWTQKQQYLPVLPGNNRAPVTLGPMWKCVRNLNRNPAKLLVMNQKDLKMQGMVQKAAKDTIM